MNNTSLNFTAKTGRGWGYCVFGKMVEGMDVVDAIEKQPTTVKNSYRDVPVTPAIIKKAVVVNTPEAKSAMKPKGNRRESARESVRESGNRRGIGVRGIGVTS